MTKQKEVVPDKRYNLPEYKIVSFEDMRIAVFPEIASWVLLKNTEQEAVFKSIVDDKLCIQELMDLYKANQKALVYVLTQIEAKQIETLHPKSIFENKKLHLHLTNKCNLRCPHCYMESGFPSKNELSKEEIFKLLEDFRNIADGKSVDLTGGEPTVRNDFFEIVEKIDSLGMETNIYTNGTTWTKEKVERLAKYNIKGVQISIDGFNEETNSVIRGSGNFEKSVNLIDLLIKHNIYVKIAISAPYEILKNHKQDYIDFAKGIINSHEKGKLQVNFSSSFMQGRNLSNEEIQKFEKGHYDNVNYVAEQVVEKQTENGFVLNVKGDLVDSCGYGALNVLANGDFYFCDRIPDMKRNGNIREMEFSKIFKLMKVAEQAGKIQNFKPCKDCEIKFICGGGCRIKEFKGFGDIEDVTDIDFEKISAKECNKEIKEKFYRLLVDTNERFYK